MLTDSALKHLKPKDKAYKVTDRDGMYVRVGTNGTISFRLDYRLNGRRETVTLGKYGAAGLSLARAREKCIDAKRMVQEGLSPSIEKQREKRRIKEAKSFGEFGEKWLTASPMADSTRAMRRSIFERELLPVWRNRLLPEITPGDLRAHCLAIVDRGALATAIHVRDIVKQIYGFAILHGEKIANPADEVGPASIATFTPKDRSLSPSEIRVLFKVIEKVATLPTIRLGMKLFLLSMVRKSVAAKVVPRSLKSSRCLAPGVAMLTPERYTARWSPASPRTAASCRGRCRVSRWLNATVAPSGPYLSRREERVVPGIDERRIVVRMMPAVTSSAIVAGPTCWLSVSKLPIAPGAFSAGSWCWWTEADQLPSWFHCSPPVHWTKIPPSASHCANPARIRQPAASRRAMKPN